MTEAELLAEIRAMAGGSGGFTSRQVAEKCGISQSRSYAVLVAMCDAGKVLPVSVRITDRHGRTTTVPGYALPEGNGDAKKAQA